MSQPPPPIPPNLLDPRRESLPPAPALAEDLSKRIDGVIVVTSPTDVYLAKASCASIRHVMGNIPITLLCDGANTNTSELERLPNVSRMVAQEVLDEETVQLFSGFWVKLIALWKSPYERFLLLDADTILWGDIRTYAKLDEFALIAVRRFATLQTVQTVEEIQKYVFDVDVIKKIEPFDWLGQPLTPSGAFFARRGAFTREDLLMLRRLDCWKCYDNGIFQFLLWRSTLRGAPKTTGFPFHLFPADTSSIPEDRFLPRDGKRPAIIHWITKKPKLGRNYKAFDDYRRMFLKMTGRNTFLNTRLLIEDIKVWLERQRRSLKKHKPGS